MSLMFHRAGMPLFSQVRFIAMHMSLLKESDRLLTGTIPVALTHAMFAQGCTAACLHHVALLLQCMLTTSHRYPSRKPHTLPDQHAQAGWLPLLLLLLLPPLSTANSAGCPAVCASSP